MGDAAGIGPEITLKLLADSGLTDRPVVIGDADILRATAQRLSLALDISTIVHPREAACRPGRVDVIEAGAALGDVKIGEISAACGAASYAFIRRAIDYAKAGEISAIVTAPIHKEALAAAGVPYPGHTEMLADFGGARQTAMMLANDQLRVVLVTIHCALREAIEKITIESVLSAIRLAHEGARSFGVTAPRVAVAGLNPHAGEGGLFGREEIDIIAPAIAKARGEGIDATGPWAGDTVFMQARQGRFDVVVAQYHDQGLIPVKYLGLDEGVNITLGLPFIRTSPDHGTAFDIAGQGIADPGSMRTALEQAVRLIAARRQQATHNEAG
ncbi:MAG: 4-hydroxythreonine-4-phosphate dehydrogenase PdxA [Alphaproteobacteria bacterium]|nr:4-hydroxythreonine-4-phosphate dehydrogenase PdxA [Alphaproteobacteria bacterium]